MQPGTRARGQAHRQLVLHRGPGEPRLGEQAQHPGGGVLLHQRRQCPVEDGAHPHAEDRGRARGDVGEAGVRDPPAVAQDEGEHQQPVRAAVDGHPQALGQAVLGAAVGQHPEHGARAAGRQRRGLQAHGDGPAVGGGDRAVDRRAHPGAGHAPEQLPQRRAVTPPAQGPAGAQLAARVPHQRQEAVGGLQRVAVRVEQHRRDRQGAHDRRDGVVHSVAPARGCDRGGRGRLLRGGVAPAPRPPGEAGGGRAEDGMPAGGVAPPRGSAPRPACPAPARGHPDGGGPEPPRPGVRGGG